jgi:hypothetical protein
MLEFGKEYFEKPYYFYLKDKGDKFSVYYSVSETIKESRESDEEVEFLKEDFSKIIKFIKKLFKSGKKFTKEQIKKLLNFFKSKGDKKVDGELQEFVGSDGSFTNSSIPMLNQRLVTKNTMDQTVKMTRANQFPFIRVYYGESEEEQENLIDEVDMSDAFGYEETKEAKSYKEASKILKQMGVEDPFERNERLETMGFDPEYDKQLNMIKKKGHGKNWFTKRRLSELEKGKMEKMIDEIVLGKKKKNDDIVKKTKDESDSTMSKLLIRNLESIKHLADKEGLDIRDLLKKIKDSE